MNSIKKIFNIILKLVQARMEGKNPASVIIWGPPGVGKSDCIREVAKALGIELRDIRLAQMDPVDLRGVPTVENGITKWAVPDFLPQDKDSAGILFLDELSSADPTIQVAAYQLILDRKCGSYTLPPKWYVCAAGNRAKDHAVSIPMSSALANRMLHLEVEADSDAWCKWAVKNGIDPDILGFIRFRPEQLFALEEDCERGWPSPRSWAGVSQTLSLGLEPEELTACVIGLVGESAAAQFLAYRKSSRTLGDIRAIMLDPNSNWKLPARNDMLYAVATAIAYWVWRGENEDEASQLLDGFFRISLQLPATFAVVAMIDAMENTTGDECAQKLAGHPQIAEWQEKFASEMEKQKGTSQ